MKDSMSDEKIIAAAFAFVATVFILSSATYCSIDEHYDYEIIKLRLEKGCAQSERVGNAGLYWKCPENDSMKGDEN